MFDLIQWIWETFHEIAIDQLEGYWGLWKMGVEGKMFVGL